jgi:signal transduction histidine kinase
MISTHWNKPYAPSERDLRVLDIIARQAADLIERKRAEEALRASEARERARAEELDELRQLAEDANRLKDEFLAIMSHELRNPLNVILGYSELLVRNEEITRNPQLQRMAETIKRNAIAQSKLIRDLLDLSRLRSGKLALNRENVSMLASVNNAIDTVRSEAAAKQIAIEIEAPDETLFVEGDNLSSNRHGNTIKWFLPWRTQARESKLPFCRTFLNSFARLTPARAARTPAWVSVLQWSSS